MPETPGPGDAGVGLLAAVLPLALVLALSPFRVLVALLLLLTPRGGRNAAAYLGAQVLVLAVVTLLAVGVGSLADPAPVTEVGVGWLEVATGAGLLVLAAAEWVRRPRGGPPMPPPWMAALDTYSARQSAQLGAALAAVNPKNLALASVAGAEIAVLASGPALTAAAAAVFVAVASLGVATPVLATTALGPRAHVGLGRGRDWLTRHSAPVSITALLLFGALLIALGLPDIA